MIDDEGVVSVEDVEFWLILNNEFLTIKMIDDKGIVYSFG